MKTLPATDWDGVGRPVPTDGMLRTRVFTRQSGPDTAASLAAFIATPHGPDLSVYVIERDGARVYWDTHLPSAEEYVHLHGGALRCLGRKREQPGYVPVTL